MSAGVDDQVDCSQVTQFELIDGELTSGGHKVSTSPDMDSAERLAVSTVVGSITRSFEIMGGELLWLNASFGGGRARFCLDGDTRSVFFTTTGAGSEPAVCVPVLLRPLCGKYSRLLLAVPGLLLSYFMKLTIVP